MFRHSPMHQIGIARFAAAFALLATLVAPGVAAAAPSQIVKVVGADIQCTLASARAAGSLFAIARDRSDGTSFAFIDLFVDPTDPAAPALSGGLDDPALTSTGVHSTFNMANDDTGDLLGSASVSATFTRTGSYRVRRVYQNAVQNGIFENLSVTGTITVTTATLSYTFDMSGCDATGQSRMDRSHHPNGPKPGGTTPANDLPAAATPVAAGTKLQQWTGGAALGSEAPCLMDFGGDIFDFGLGRTVWFSIQGTGRPITVDPSGSDFDTVVATYGSSAAGIEPIGCVDDDAIHQAQGSLTFDTTAGVTYLVQVGGVVGVFGGDPDAPQWGRLRLHVS